MNSDRPLYDYPTMTPGGSYGSTVHAPDVDAAIREATRMGYKVLDVTDSMTAKGNPEHWLLVIEE